MSAGNDWHENKYKGEVIMEKETQIVNEKDVQAADTHIIYDIFAMVVDTVHKKGPAYELENPSIGFEKAFSMGEFADVPKQVVSAMRTSTDKYSCFWHGNPFMQAGYVLGNMLQAMSDSDIHMLTKQIMDMSYVIPIPVLDTYSDVFESYINMAVVECDPNTESEVMQYDAQIAMDSNDTGIKDSEHGTDSEDDTESAVCAPDTKPEKRTDAEMVESMDDDEMKAAAERVLASDNSRFQHDDTEPSEDVAKVISSDDIDLVPKTNPYDTLKHQIEDKSTRIMANTEDNTSDIED